MNTRQKKFIDCYIQNGGNASQAARESGYSQKTAYSIAERLLRNVEILGAITERNSQLESSSIADMSECLSVITSIMRGEITTSRMTGEGILVTTTPTFAERNRAVELRLKTLGAFIDRSDNKEALDKLDQVLEKISADI